MLAPVGVYAITIAREYQPRWLPFAAFPLAFSMQQAIEGFVWVGLNSGDAALVSAASRGFLFFSHFYWLAWPPFAAYRVEPDPGRRKVLGLLTVVGALFGLSIFLPAFWWSDGLNIEIIEGNLEYKTRLIYEGIVGRPALRVFYALIVISALLFSSHRQVQIFGGLILTSVLFTYWAFPHAFISVWCYFAAILSAYVLAMLWHARHKRTAAVRSASP